MGSPAARHQLWYAWHASQREALLPTQVPPLCIAGIIVAAQERAEEGRVGDVGTPVVLLLGYNRCIGRGSDCSSVERAALSRSRTLTSVVFSPQPSHALEHRWCSVVDGRRHRGEHVF